jgi:hypothetical protein
MSAKTRRSGFASEPPAGARPSSKQIGQLFRPASSTPQDLQCIAILSIRDLALTISAHTYVQGVIE